MHTLGNRIVLTPGTAIDFNSDKVEARTLWVGNDMMKHHKPA